MSKSNANKTVLVTGANSGLGFEAAAQLAERGWGTVILACRTEDKAEGARSRLVERTGKDVFVTLAIDTSEVASAQAAADEIEARGTFIDGLVLNAGASSAQPHHTSQGIEVTWASTLVGHHVFTLRLLQAGLLGPEARVVIAGSEGARGTLPGMNLHDIEGIATRAYDGDYASAIVGLAKTEVQDTFVNMDDYVTAKLVVAWWAAALAKKLPAGMTVNAVSPGSAPGSNFARGAGVGMKIMVGFMKLLGPMMGMAGSLEPAAKRYVDALEYGPEVNGEFHATANLKKLVGPMGRQDMPHFSDPKGIDAAFEALVRITGVDTQTARAAAE
jgi:NAD(P)-dependent dehydrogenase (short-subunit alcohol dehydrogenase family)